ncbi:hypothetical protein FACS1894103_7070 [Campylobacterota bacterium]|nr:hypothetical protein FACS1894103_7070 [Campylobacterota bacterium]
MIATLKFTDKNGKGYCFYDVISGKRGTSEWFAEDWAHAVRIVDAWRSRSDWFSVTIEEQLEAAREDIDHGCDDIIAECIQHLDAGYTVYGNRMRPYKSWEELFWAENEELKGYVVEVIEPRTAPDNYGCGNYVIE